MNLFFVNLEGVRVLGIDDEVVVPEVHVELEREVVGCPACGVVASVKDRHRVCLVDLTMAGRQVILVWNKRRFVCKERGCPAGTWTEVEPRIAAPRLKMTDRAARWATFEVGRNGRTVAEVAEHLGCDWHTVNDAVLAYGSALIDHPERFGDVSSIGLDEHLMVKLGERRRQHFVTAIVDVDRGQLLDVVADRRAEAPTTWLRGRGEEWLSKVSAGTLDLSSTYRSVFAAALPHAELVADPFHVIRHATAQVDLARRRVQNEVFGHRGRKDDPLYRARRLLTMAAERLDENGTEKMLGLVRAGDRYGQVEMTWSAKEAVRELYTVPDYELAGQFIDELIRDMADKTWPIEVRSLSRTLKRWRNEIIGWHKLHITNGPTEAMILWSAQNRVHDVAYQ